MKYFCLLWYRVMIRLVPKAVEWDKLKLTGPVKVEDKKDYFLNTNLATYSYSFLKKHCQYGLQYGEQAKIDRIFSPLDLTIGMKICSAVWKMGTRPECAINNRKYMSGYYTLFYKRQIADLRCTFELHFHKATLFMYQLSFYHEKGSDHAAEVNLTELLLGTYMPTNESDAKSGLRHYEDKIAQSVCAVDDIFRTRFIVTHPNHPSLNQLLAAKYKSRTLSQEKNYQGLFLRTS